MLSIGGMKIRLVGGLAIAGASVAIISSGTVLGAGHASAALNPGTYRQCITFPVAPGAGPQCTTATAQAFLAADTSYGGYGAFVSTPTGGYRAFAVLGAENGRKVYRKNTSGYDVTTYSYGVPVTRATMTRVG